MPIFRANNKTAIKKICKPIVSLGFVLVGFSFESTLITEHMRVLHSSPNWPYFPNRIGTKGINDMSQAVGGSNLQAY